MVSIENRNKKIKDFFKDSITFPEKSDRRFHKYNFIENEKTQNIPEYLVSFSKNSENYCIGMVDMVNSTKISATLGEQKISRYYQIFINSMSKILHRFGGYVIKNIGDCVLYYFSHTLEQNSKFSILACLECGLEMIEFRKILCEQLKSEGLPCIDYRISADFGSVMIMKSNNSLVTDMIGPPVNMCSKINKLAGKNEFVIGGDFYEQIKKFSEYEFNEKEGYNIGFKYPYSVYMVTRKH